MKLCISCQLVKSETEFSRKGSGWQSSCKACVSLYHQLYYRKNREKYFAKNRRNKNRQRARLRKIILEAKQNPCQDCGGTFHPWVMEFDHREDTVKIGAVGNLISKGCTDRKLLNELAKCDLVCANCHRMRTFYRHQSKKGGAEN